MTAFVPSPLTLILVSPDPHTLRIAVHGDLDHATHGELMDTAAAALADPQDLRELRIDCAELRVCDSSGLSALLMIHRRATGAGVRLHLDRRGPALDRILTVTGILGHLTGEPLPRHHTGQGSTGQD
ncbi:STAS domain-containing protein [Nonomuraea sp. LPB2021202275-12-8]|uniref:STAS domain-containing protein n=1 Tax=Nonomuraea sp. LPB2021202275-12-8 TaxID=3120159 RepID=UPI00300DAF04